MKQFVKNNVMLFLFFVSSVVVLILSFYVREMMTSSAQMIEESTKSQMMALSEAASLLVTAEELDEFKTVADMQKPQYRELKNKLDVFTRQAGVMFTYYMCLDTDTGMMQFIVDNVMDEADDPDGLDSPQIPREDGPDRALAGEILAMELGSYSQGWDGLLTAWAPVYYSDGTLSNMVAGVDMQDVYLYTVRNNTQLMSIVLLVSFLLVIVSCFLCLMMYRNKAKQSATASSAKGLFLSRMSHEMRTPLNAIIGLSNMALKTEDTAAIKNHLRNISVSSDHLRRLIDDILDLSKIESGKMQLEYAPALLEKEIEAIDHIIRPQTEQKDQTFLVKTVGALPKAVYYDPVRMRQVLINLLSNAVKFTPQGGQIALTVGCEERHDGRCNLYWRVKDSGIGIKKEDISKLFAPFEQLDVSTTRKYGGTGLGLAITKQLVEMMDGHITVNSEEGDGSEFVFNTWFEIADEKAIQKLEQAQKEKRHLNLSGRYVLLADDAKVNQIVAVDMLESFGAEVDTADNGREAVEKYLANPQKYDVIFMDIQMPEMDGYEATAKIRDSGAPGAGDIPIIAITANAFREDEQRSLAARMNGHIRKPLDLEQVEDTIFAVLDQKVKVE